MRVTESPHPAWRALVVDDEAPGRLNLRLMLAAHPDWRLVGECASAAEARALLAVDDVDVVLLDIHMPGESGLALARSLSERDEPPLVVFVTAFNDYAVDAFELHALDYLLKPIQARRLAQALERAGQMLALRQRAPYGLALRDYLGAAARAAGGVAPAVAEHLSVRSVGRIERIRLADVFWIGAAGNYVELHLAGRTVLHRVPLSRLEQSLDPRRFLRVHRRAIVRADQIRALAVVGDGSYLLTLHCGAEVGVSERYVEGVRARCC